MNLSFNKIPSMKELVRVSSRIEKLWLEGNPLCSENDAMSYLQEICKKFPRLKELLLVEAYNEALSERTCEWFRKFKNCDFDVEDKDRSGRPKIYEVAELEVLLEEHSSQTQKELALTLEVTWQAVSHRSRSLRMIHKQGTWLPYGLKLRDVERRLCTSEMLLAKHKKKSLVMKSGYIMITQKEENHGDYLATRQHPQQNRIFMPFGGISRCGVLRVA
ncbi:Mariner Mos1 transposase [Eumeta japonica]|uniref:Mariner Mos1 transposase n=1 Tax=Eumeta variegata TaxID=151549 RepID=A0A4C1TQA4_EUMVA|nr:Mariner Mos1 transposase [Eumeta japonica]